VEIESILFFYDNNKACVLCTLESCAYRKLQQYKRAVARGGEP